jgi:hypothetical protein
MESNARDAKLTDAPHGAPARACVYYVPREDVTPAGELAALAAVYRFVLECHDGHKKGSRSERVGEGAQKPSSQEREPGVAIGGHDE